MKIQTTLNNEQLKAVKHGQGPLLIIAGAGSGKTTVVTERIKHLILEKKVSPGEILALTFTEKAAFEMQERVDMAMPYGYTQMWILTFHSFCDRILRQEAIHIGLNPSYKLMTEAETILFLKNNLFKFELDYFRPLGNPNKFLEALIQHFSRLKDEDINSKEYDKWIKEEAIKKTENKEEVKKYSELAKAYKTYEELKTKEGVMDFADLISNTLLLFRARKNILKNYQNQFKYVLVDEFQDTNYAQNQLAILLSGDRENITVVGDDDQSIYRFRGSSISNIIQFKKIFPQAKIVTLTKNYRSTAEILDKSYNLIQFNNPDRLEVKEKINKKLVSMRGIRGENIEFIYKTRVEDEAEAVAKKIIKLCDKKYQYQDIAILVRANDYSESFTRALERAKIPYQFLGPGRLFQQEEIKDLISYLKVLYNFEDSSSLYRVLNIRNFNFEPIEIASFLNSAKRKNYNLFDALQNIDQIFLKEKTKKKAENMVEMIKRHLKLVPKETAGQILYYFLQDSGILKEIVGNKKPEDETRIKNIAKFFDKLKTYETEHKSASVFDIIDWIDLSMQLGESPLASDIDWSENNAVNILTVHSSKGLEFPVVFLVNLVTQRFPSRDRREKIPIPEKLVKEILPVGDYHLEEEKRLFYVGMTRAKDLLFLTASSFYGEGKKERKISPFVYETLGEKIILKEIEKIKEIDREEQLSLLEWTADQRKNIEKKMGNFAKINYLSYSQIQTFDICPLHYKLKYILKIPTPQTAAQSFGISIHSAFRDFYLRAQDYKKIKLIEIIPILEKNWINEGYDNKLHEKKAFLKAKNLVLNYLKNNFDRKNLPLALELPFQFLIDGLKIGGRIDRIDKFKNNQIEIIDYKTGLNLPEEKELVEDKQLTVYALAATEVNDKLLNKNPEEVMLSLYFLEKDKKLTTTRNANQLQKAKRFLTEKAEEIAKSNFECSRSNLCRNCEYKMLCLS